jgi:hypothetical protein
MDSDSEGEADEGHEEENDPNEESKDEVEPAP